MTVEAARLLSVPSSRWFQLGHRGVWHAKLRRPGSWISAAIAQNCVAPDPLAGRDWLREWAGDGRRQTVCAATVSRCHGSARILVGPAVAHRPEFSVSVSYA